MQKTTSNVETYVLIIRYGAVLRSFIGMCNHERDDVAEAKCNEWSEVVPEADVNDSQRFVYEEQNLVIPLSLPEFDPDVSRDA